MKAGEEIYFAVNSVGLQKLWITKLYTATGQTYKPSAVMKKMDSFSFDDANAGSLIYLHRLDLPAGKCENLFYSDVHVKAWTFLGSIPLGRFSMTEFVMLWFFSAFKFLKRK